MWSSCPALKAARRSEHRFDFLYVVLRSILAIFDSVPYQEQMEGRLISGGRLCVVGISHGGGRGRANRSALR